MKKQLLLIIFIFSFLQQSFSQNPLVKQWDYRFGGTNPEFLWSFQQTTMGGYILGGNSSSGIGGDKTQPSWGADDYWIVKLDSIGNMQWDKRFGGTGGDILYSLQETSDKGYILGGESTSGISGDKTQNNWGVWDYWIVKIDSSGNKQWDKRFGGTDSDAITSLMQTMDGGYILGGVSTSGISGDKTEASWGGGDYWIVKTDSLGNKEWDKRYGGTSYDGLYSVLQTSDEGYILGGYSSSGISGDKSEPSWGAYDYWIIKIDSVGNKQWDKRFGGDSLDYFLSMDQSIDNGFVLGGYSLSRIGGDKTHDNWDTLCNPICTYDFWIVKIDSLGNKQWDKTFGGTSDEDDFGTISQTDDGGYLVAGSSYSFVSGDKTENNLGVEQMWIIKTDSLGIKEWDKTVFNNGHDERGMAIQTNDGCFTMANYTGAGIGGYKTQTAWNNSLDYWIIKFCDSTATTSITQLPDTQYLFSIYPNPVDELLVISDKKTGKKEIEIYDLSGRTVLHSTFNPDASGHSTFTIDISSLISGIYFLKAGNEVRKFVKE